MVLRARDGEPSSAREALEALCVAYWQPMYGFARRRGLSPENAADLVQAYFAAFLEKHFLNSVLPEHGRFRSFVLASLQHFLANEWDRAHAEKRGGRFVHVSLTPGEGEVVYAREPVDELTPELVYERRWALTVIDRVTRSLEDEARATGTAERFAVLRGFLTDQRGTDSYRVAGERLGMTEGAVKVAVHRLRRRFGEQLRAEIADTVADPSQIDAEIRHLLQSLG